jgi:hypothetical protein
MLRLIVLGAAEKEIPEQAVLTGIPDTDILHARIGAVNGGWALKEPVAKKLSDPVFPLRHALLSHRPAGRIVT